MKKQSGVVLVISLVMLLLLTLIGISGTQTSTLEEKMAGNMRDKDLAFQAAESAMVQVETTLDPNTLVFDPSGTGGYYSEDSALPTEENLIKDFFWANNPVATSSLTTLGTVNTPIAPPLFIVQRMPGGATCFMPTPPGCQAGQLRQPYKITVRATGASPNSVVILQSVYVPD
jgi:type IV pilus assembly protein PilX